ncbi:hypothetical protein ACFVZN_04225 [Streptomyces virginiae]|uniref:hypothetical protein n=1 Tax=Streptomyces virginiae TaxID=1961 RepID=UPI00367CA716
MNLNDRSDSASSRGAAPKLRSGRRRAIFLSTVAVVLLAGATLSCSSQDSSQDVAPSPTWTSQMNPATEAFRKYLAKDKANEDLTDLFIHVVDAPDGQPVATRILTGLNRDSAGTEIDKAKAERIARAFADWHTADFKDHGTVRVSGQIGKALATLEW